MSYYYLAGKVPHVTVTGVQGTYVTIIAAILVIIGTVAWEHAKRATLPPWIGAILIILATTVASATPHFGPWLQTQVAALIHYAGGL